MTDEEYEEYRSRNKLISRDEQERQGHQLKKYDRFVPSVPNKQVVMPPVKTEHNMVIDVPTNAQLMSVVQSTEIDRSTGYLMRTVPLSIAFAIVVVAVAITLADEEFLSWLSFVIFFVSFVGAWMFGEYRHGKSSPNAAALEEIKRKWDNIDANDARRWDAWEKATGITVPGGAGLWIEKYKGWILLWVVVTVFWMAAMSVILLGER